MHRGRQRIVSKEVFSRARAILLAYAQVTEANASSGCNRFGYCQRGGVSVRGFARWMVDDAACNTKYWCMLQGR